MNIERQSKKKTLSKVDKMAIQRIPKKNNNQNFNTNLDFESGFWNIRAFRPDLII